MGVVSLMSLQGCSDDATTGDTNTGGTTGGTAGSGGTTGGTAGSGGSTGGKGGTAGSSGTTGGTAGSGGSTGGTAGSGGTTGGSAGSGGGGAGGTSGGTAGTGGGGGSGGDGGSGGGGSDKAARCAVYCADFEETCGTMFDADYGDEETCKTDCEEWELGTVGASGPTIECRIQHTTNAKTMQTEVHCGHARKASTGQCI
jgi:hypothetical protein